jgi:hypothetical protein
MKKLLLSASAIVAVAAISSSAFAADLPARTYTKAPAYTAPALVYNWTGFYIGGHVGGAFNGSNGFGGTSDNSAAVSSAVCRSALTTSSLRTGSLVSKPSTAGLVRTTPTSLSFRLASPTT